MTTEAQRFDWQPGNGTRYDLVCAQVGNRTLITWLNKGGSGGTSMLFSEFLHYSYMVEKMGIGIADAIGIMMFLETRGHKVGYPASPDFKISFGTAECMEIN